MTDRHEPTEPPSALPSDLLADLDAGLLDPARAAEVRAAADRDPHAAAVLAALATTRAELGELPDPPVPAEYAARWDAALAAEAARPEPAAPPPPASPSGRRLPRSAPSSDRRRMRPALVAAVLLAGVVVAGVLWTPREPAAPSLDRVDLARAGLAVRGDFDVGDLSDPAWRAGCLRAAASPGVAPDAPLLGGRDVVLDGRDGVLLLLGTGVVGRVHIVVVAPGCGPESGELLSALTLGG